MHDTAALKRPFLFAIVLLLLVAVFFAGKWGVAAASHQVAMNHLHSWLKSGKKPDVKSWTSVKDALTLARELDESNADYHNDLGRFYAYSLKLPLASPEKRGALLDSGLASFRQASQIRPTWAIAWANLALLKHQRGQIDDEFQFAVAKAIEHGSALEDIQLIISEVAVANWGMISRGLREQVLENTRHALHGRAAKKVMAIITQYQLKPYICLKLAKDEQEKFCKY